MDYEKLASPPGLQDDFKLDRIRRLLELLGNPGRGRKLIQVAGTKGKGSTCAILSSILSEAGNRVGMFTSPHLVTIRERIRLGGTPVEEKEFLRLVRRIAPAIEKMEKS